jgi:hypothetical protein
MTLARRRALRLFSKLFVGITILGVLAVMSTGDGPRKVERGGQQSSAAHSVAHDCAGGGGDLAP